MQRTIIRAVLVGIVAGLIVGVYHNIFTVPVIERAIILEEERAAAALPSGVQPSEEPPLVSLGMQRVGMAIGMGVLGAVFGLAFAGTYGLIRWATPDFNPIAASIIAGAAGFLGAVVPGVCEVSVCAAGGGKRRFAGFPSGFPVAVLHHVSARRSRCNTGSERDKQQCTVAICTAPSIYTCGISVCWLLVVGVLACSG